MTLSVVKSPIGCPCSGQTYKLVVHTMADADLPVEGGADAALLKQLEEKGARSRAVLPPLKPGNNPLPFVVFHEMRVQFGSNLDPLRSQNI
jgi:hypothetical protein